MNRKSIWVWYSDAPQGGYLFRGNPNLDCPPYHTGDVCHMIFGYEIVCAETRKALEMEVGIAEWQLKFPKFKVKAKRIVVEIRPYGKNESGVKE